MQLLYSWIFTSLHYQTPDNDGYSASFRVSTQSLCTQVLHTIWSHSLCKEWCTAHNRYLITNEMPKRSSHLLHDTITIVTRRTAPPAPCMLSICDFIVDSKQCNACVDCFSIIQLKIFYTARKCSIQLSVVPKLVMIKFDIALHLLLSWIFIHCFAYSLFAKLWSRVF